MSRSKKSKKRAPSADTETEIEVLREERDAAVQEAASLRQLLEDREHEDCPRCGPNARGAVWHAISRAREAVKDEVRSTYSL